LNDVLCQQRSNAKDFLLNVTELKTLNQLIFYTFVSLHLEVSTNKKIGLAENKRSVVKPCLKMTNCSC